jgi:putative DNA primase/helicase
MTVPSPCPVDITTSAADAEPPEPAVVAARPGVLVENVPACLRERPQWVVWRYVERDGRTAKVPYDPRTRREADTTDPTTWASFGAAVDALGTWRGLAGVGFVFAPDDPYCGVDLDDSLDPATGALKPWAREIVDRLASYVEVSPSLCGAKVFLRARKPGARCRRAYADGEVEIYDHARFFTVTGRPCDGPRWEVADRQAELDRVYQMVFANAGGGVPAPAAPAADDGPPSFDYDADVRGGDARGGAAPLADEEIVRKAARSRSGGKFADLWAGRWEGRFRSRSEADASLVFALTFYTKDAGQLDRLFRASGLMRPKWDEARGGRTYGAATVDLALATVTAQWRPQAAGSGRAGGCRGGEGGGFGGGSGASSPSSDWQPDHLSQQVNAERLVEELAGEARYNADKGCWLWYDGRRFADDREGRVNRAAKRVARQTWSFVADGLAGVDPKAASKHAVDSEKAAGVAAMMTLAQTEPGVPARAADLDADRYLFNCTNGTLDLRTGSLRPHDRRDLLTLVAPVAYHPTAPRPLFDAFVRRIMGGSEAMVAYLARVLGRCLTGDVCEQELYFFIGEGANGKSVLVDTVLGLLGDYAGTAPESLLTVQAHNEHPTEIADLCGKRLVVASETEEGARLKVQLVKRLTGDQRLKGRFMRQDFFEFDRTHKLVIVSNNKPLIRETKHAIWRRIRLVPFGVIIPEPERDTALTEKLVAERPGILAWLAEGYRDWRAGGMRTPPEVLLATRTYQREQDPLVEYLADRCVLRADARVGRSDLYADYVAWCRRAGEAVPLSRTALFDAVRSAPGVREDQWRVPGNPVPVRGFGGVGLSAAGEAL